MKILRLLKPDCRLHKSTFHKLDAFKTRRYDTPLTRFMLKTYCIVMMGGAVGTGLRLWLATLLTPKQEGAFPVGTLAVNIIGSFIISLFAGLTGPQGLLSAPPEVKDFVTIGVLGGFTTFSSFSLQTLTMTVNGDWPRAGLYVGLSLGLCLLAAWAGNLMAGQFNHR